MKTVKPIPETYWKIILKRLDRPSRILVIGDLLPQDRKRIPVFADVHWTVNPTTKVTEIDPIHLVISGKFDLIFSHFELCSLTLTELEKSLLNQSLLLNKKGRIFHSFWAGFEEGDPQGDYFLQHQKNGLRDLFEMNYDLKKLKFFAQETAKDALMVEAKAISV